jgi:NAD+ kinase
MAGESLQLIILARDASPRIEQALAELRDFLSRQSGVRVAAAGALDELSIDGVDADLVVTLGGDGAILRACRKLGRRQQPILGINLGRLGFLADLSPREFRDVFPQIQQRRYRVVDHLMFDCEIQRADGSSERHLGLNEVVVSSAASLKMLAVNLAIDGELVTTYSCDGLIVSTPIGSTAHSMSAGGPILRQDLRAFVITPICPHTLTNRPLVDDAGCTYTLTVPDVPTGAMIVVDGQIRRPLLQGDMISISAADVTFQLAKVPGHSYYRTLHRKLGWGGQPRYRDI